jgi:hypothetical protein
MRWEEEEGKEGLGLWSWGGGWSCLVANACVVHQRIDVTEVALNISHTLLHSLRVSHITAQTRVLRT